MSPLSSAFSTVSTPHASTRSSVACMGLRVRATSPSISRPSTTYSSAWEARTPRTRCTCRPARCSPTFHCRTGTQNCTARLLIGPGAVVYPQELLDEIAGCDVSAERLSIDPLTMVIEPADKDKEVELRGRIASTASGAGYATARRIMRGEDVRLAGDVPDLYPYIRPAAEILEFRVRASPADLPGGYSGQRAVAVSRALPVRNLARHERLWLPC